MAELGGVDEVERCVAVLPIAPTDERGRAQRAVEGLGVVAGGHAAAILQEDDGDVAPLPVEACGVEDEVAQAAAEGRAGRALTGVEQEQAAVGGEGRADLGAAAAVLAQQVHERGLAAARVARQHERARQRGVRPGARAPQRVRVGAHRRAHAVQRWHVHRPPRARPRRRQLAVRPRRQREPVCQHDCPVRTRLSRQLHHARERRIAQQLVTR